MHVGWPYLTPYGIYKLGSAIQSLDFAMPQPPNAAAIAARYRSDMISHIELREKKKQQSEREHCQQNKPNEVSPLQLPVSGYEFRFFITTSQELREVFVVELVEQSQRSDDVRSQERLI